MRISRNIVNLVRGTDSAFDPGMIQDDGSVIVRLEKALYGLRQSGRIWHDLLSSKLEGLGYVRSDIDHCIFTKIDGISTTHIAVDVDDLLMVGNDPKRAPISWKRFASSLTKFLFRLKTTCPLSV
jgi:hypothetical protein